MFGPAGEVRNAKHGECRVFTLFDVAAKSLDVLRGFALYLGIVPIWMSPWVHVCSFSSQASTPTAGFRSPAITSRVIATS